MSCELLTGATGFLGSHLFRDALIAGREVAVVVRPSRTASAERRVEALMTRFRQETSAPLATPKVIAGDVSKPDLGLDKQSRAWIAEHCDRVMHCAASITFRFKAGEPYRSNVDGTRYMLELSKAAGIRDFHLVSTAYVCGGRDGLVMEDDLECSQEFSNDYERSKFVGEVLVRQAPFLDRWSVYRPSVIVGDSTTGFAPSGDGLYAFLSVCRLIGALSADDVFARMGMPPDARLNLVPVDWLSAVIRHVADRPSKESATYHLTNPKPVMARDLLNATFQFAADAPQVPESALDDLLAVYRPYLKHHCTFDLSNTTRDASHLSCPAIEGEVLNRLLNFFTTHGFGDAGQRVGRIDVAISVAGPGGGTFDLTSPATSREITPDEAEAARVCAHCTADTLARLIEQDLTVEQAIFMGVLALEGEAAGMTSATNRLEAYLAKTRNVAGQRAVGQPS